MTVKFDSKQPMNTEQTEVLGGLPVRTDLRAGLAWDELDDQAIALWNKLSSAVSNAASSLSSSTTTSTES